MKLKSIVSLLSMLLVAQLTLSQPVHAEGGAPAALSAAPAASFSASAPATLSAPSGQLSSAPGAGGITAPLAPSTGPLSMQPGIPAQSTSALQPPQPATSQLTAPIQGVADPALQATQPQSAPPQPPPTQGAVVEMSNAERSMLDSGSGADKSTPQEFKVKSLKQFGYSFFRPDMQGFSALTDIPVGPDYQLGAGDRIVMTVWGSLEGSYELEVNRSGELVLPKVGSVKVAGTTFGQLPKLLTGHLAKVFRDFNLNVTMGKLRMIKVYVVGDVKSPGDYSISSLSTLINALSAAGGPTTNGSLRSISIVRDGKQVDSVDLYSFFLKGDKSRDIRLQPGDTIFVPPVGPVAGIAGNVRRPAIYELKEENNLKELLELANGIVPTGYLQRMQISRVEANDKKIITDINLDPTKSGKALDQLTASIAIKDMDLVKIFPIDGTLRGYVRLEGYVLRPGDYALQPGMRIEQLLGQDNLLPEYHTEAGQIIRLMPPDFHPELIFFNVSRAMAKDPECNLELEEFDIVRIFSRWEMEEMPRVRISGDIQKPGEYRYFTNMRVRDLLIFAGNPKLTAYLNDAELTRLKLSASSVSSYPISINLAEALKGNPQHNIPLEPHDELTVRKIPNWADENERYITLKGEFVFPGAYPIFKGEKLSSVIHRAGGFSPKAHLKGAKFTRSSVRELQQKRMDEFVASAEMDINSKMSELASTASSAEELAATKASIEGVRRSLQMLKSAKAEGRMVIQLSQPETFSGSPYDIEVLGGDTLEVPQRTNSVSVLGRVTNPTNFVFTAGNSVGDYLDLAGGITHESNDDEMYVIRADGSVFSRQQYSSLGSLVGGGFLNEQIDSGDAIIVPQKFEKTAWMRNLKDITTIISQIAISAGTVFLGLR
ncbi:MAG: polysaccharide biosynthesis protein [Geobacteraceae bacterium GWC2_55_20]|nr:MAG: polysaccharide biosynthesis protein [Geobacteraceae bacterium GWC2_55_20]